MIPLGIILRQMSAESMPVNGRALTSNPNHTPRKVAISAAGFLFPRDSIRDFVQNIAITNSEK